MHFASHTDSLALALCTALPQKSLELQPEATQVAHMLAQLQLAAGDANGEALSRMQACALLCMLRLLCMACRGLVSFVHMPYSLCS